MRHVMKRALVLVALVACGATVALAEDFSTDQSARYTRQVTGSESGPYTSSMYFGAPTYADQTDLTVSGGHLIAAIPNSADDSAADARFSAIRVATADDPFFAFPGDNATFYAGDLFGNATGKKLVARFRINSSLTDGTTFTSADFWGDQYGFPGTRGTPPNLPIQFLINRQDAGKANSGWSANAFISQGMTYDAIAMGMQDNVYVTIEASLDNPSLWTRYSDGENGSSLAANSTFLTTRSNLTEIELMFGTGFGVDTGFAFADGGPTGQFELDFIRLEVIPEPATLSLLALSGLAMLRRRH